MNKNCKFFSFDSSKFQLSAEPLPVFMNDIKPAPRDDESPREKELQVSRSQRNSVVDFMSWLK